MYSPGRACSSCPSSTSCSSTFPGLCSEEAGNEVIISIFESCHLTFANHYSHVTHCDPVQVSPPRPTTPPRPPPTSSRPTNRPTSSSRPTTATTSISFPHFAGELSSKGHGVRGDVILLTDSRLLIHRYVPKHPLGPPVLSFFSCPDFGTTGQLQGSHSSQAPPQNGRHPLASPSQWQRSTPLRSRCESTMFSRSGC